MFGLGYQDIDINIKARSHNREDTASDADHQLKSGVARIPAKHRVPEAGDRGWDRKSPAWPSAQRIRVVIPVPLRAIPVAAASDILTKNARV